jgi:hypothetical protein
MALNTLPTMQAIQSVVAATGFFTEVNLHEPKNAPASGPAAAIWVDRTLPSPTDSGLQKTTAVVVYACRLYQNMLYEPQDLIDPTLQAAADQIMTDLSGDFELGGNARNVDLLGQTGIQLSAQAGYVTVDTTLFRIIDIEVPVIINDAFDQAP